MQNIVNYLKKNGFIFANSSIYDNLKHIYDYGPLGINIKNNIKHYWLKHFVGNEANNHLIDSAIFNANSVWEASGHLTNFFDIFIDCKDCHHRFRLDECDEIQNMTEKEICDAINAQTISCLSCQSTNLTYPRSFNLMFKVNTSLLEENNKIPQHLYLRPETAQGIFTNYKNIQQALRLKIPFGIAQIGKAFRNEVTPKNFLFKTREFEQAEIEYFCHPDQWESAFDYYLQKCHVFLLKIMGFKKINLVAKEHGQSELAHYSLKTIDYNFAFPFGSKELMGISCRGDYDLKAHQANSKVNMAYLDQSNNTKFIPFVIEPSFGLDRLFLALICQNLNTETLPDDSTRIILKVPFHLASYQIAVLPLASKLREQAHSLYLRLKQQSHWQVTYDDTQSIGRRYRRQDEIGTPICITFDFDSLNDDCVTVRDRDTMKQTRLKISELLTFINSNYF